MKAQEEYKRGPSCPNCGSPNTTVYPMDEEGSATLYCDDCKREDLYEDIRTKDERHTAGLMTAQARDERNPE